MNPHELRLEALRLAAQLLPNSSTDEIVERAEAFVEFLDLQPEPGAPIVDVVPQ